MKKDNQNTVNLDTYKLKNDNETRTDYFSIGQIGFLRTRDVDGKTTNMFDKMEDIATLVVISSFNTQDMTSSHLCTHQLTPFMIASRFGFKNQSRNASKVLESIENLRRNNVISIIDAETGKKMDSDKELEKHTLMKVYQTKSRNVIAKGVTEDNANIYNSMLHQYFNAIVDGHKYSDNDKFNLLATYATITTRINAFNKNGYKNASGYTMNYTESNYLIQVVNFESHVKQAETAHMSRKTFGKYAKLLVEIGVLSRVGVKRKNATNGKVSYYYSKAYQSNLLSLFLGYAMDDKLPPQYSYLAVESIVSPDEEVNDKDIDDDVKLNTEHLNEIEDVLVEEQETVEIEQEIVEEVAEIQAEYAVRETFEDMFDDDGEGTMQEVVDMFVRVDDEEKSDDNDATANVIVFDKDKIKSLKEEKEKEKNRTMLNEGGWNVIE